MIGGGKITIAGDFQPGSSSTSQIKVNGKTIDELAKTDSGAHYFKNIMATLFITVGVLVQMQ